MNADFETSCAADLKKCGAYKYTLHPTFRINTLAYRLDSQSEYKLWKGFYDETLNPMGTDVPQDLVDALNSGEEINAWNASFERYCLEHMARRDSRIKTIPLEQYVCTMQRAAIVGLPLSLEKCGSAVRCEVQKNLDGRSVMLQIAKPRNPKKLPSSEWEYQPKGNAFQWYTRRENPDKFEIQDSYCLTDVKSEEAIAAKLPPMRAGERLLATIDARINRRGLPIDRPAVERALELVDFFKEDGNRQISELTGGYVEKTTALPKLKEWLKERGCEVDSLNKETLKELLQGDLTPEVRAVLELRSEGSAASLSKLQKMLHVCCEDDRMRDQFQYSGAHTGRWAGRGTQPQNFFKGWGLEEQHTPHDAPPVEQTKFFEILMQNKPLPEVAADLRAEFGNLVDAMKHALRGFIKAPDGYELFVCDFSGIENRVVAWLSEETPMLDAFKNKEDLYKLTAAGIYGVPVEEVTKSQRQLGKVCVLAAQFGQGPKGYQQSCKSPWGIDIDLKEAKQTIKGYRETYPKLRKFWYDLYGAMMNAVMTGETQVVKNLRAEYDGTSLQVVLPSGRRIHYWNPTVIKAEAPWSYYEMTLNFEPTEEQLDEWGIEELKPGVYKLRDMDQAAFTAAVNFRDYTLGARVLKYCHQLYHEKQHNNSWKHINKDSPSYIHSTWHGVAVENVTQAVARDVLAEAVVRVEHAGFELIGYVHDELIALVKKGTKTYAEFEKVMLQTPRWAKGLPIDGEGYVAERYRK